jgi:hypothetical protein
VAIGKGPCQLIVARHIKAAVRAEVIIDIVFAAMRRVIAGRRAGVEIESVVVPIRLDAELRRDFGDEIAIGMRRGGEDVVVVYFVGADRRVGVEAAEMDAERIDLGPRSRTVWSRGTS